MSRARTRWLLLLVAGAVTLAGASCTVSGGDGDPESGGFDVQYCEQDERGSLQDDRCTTEPGRYRDGSYTGSPSGLPGDRGYRDDPGGR